MHELGSCANEPPHPLAVFATAVENYADPSLMLAGNRSPILVASRLLMPDPKRLERLNPHESVGGNGIDELAISRHNVFASYGVNRQSNRTFESVRDDKMDWRPFQHRKSIAKIQGEPNNQGDTDPEPNT